MIIKTTTMKQLYVAGNKVILLHTKEEGIIIKIQDEHSAIVEVDGDDIPIFIEDMMLADEYYRKEQAKKDFEWAIAKEKDKNKPVLFNNTYTGIHLAFEPMKRLDGSIYAYQMYLLNDTSYVIVFNSIFTIKNQAPKKISEHVPAGDVYNVGILAYDYLNDSPAFKIDCWQNTTEGRGERMHKEIKIKAKQFFARKKIAPILQKECHVYEIFKMQDKAAVEAKKKTVNLKTYTKQNAKAQVIKNQHYNIVDVKQRAAMSHEIDLHIEKLAKTSKKLTNGEKLMLQLQHFDAYIAKAVELSLPRVFVIHGVGKGRLRDEIATRLIKNPWVKSFKNEHHPRYGFGATEVFF